MYIQIYIYIYIFVMNTTRFLNMVVEIKFLNSNEKLGQQVGCRIVLVGVEASDEVVNRLQGQLSEVDGL